MGHVTLYLKFYIIITHLFIILNLASAFTPVTEALHEFMTEPELGYYFGTSEKNKVPDYQIVYLPVVLTQRDEEASSIDSHGQSLTENDGYEYGFNAFGRQVDLTLRPNNVLISPVLKVIRRDGDAEDDITEQETQSNCHYLHRDGNSVAAISLCQNYSVNGLVFLDNATLEIRPLTDRLSTLLKLREALEDDTTTSRPLKTAPHIVRRAPFITESFTDDALPIHKNLLLESFNEEDTDTSGANFTPELTLLGDESKFYKMKRSITGLTVEVALFFDEAAYKLFMPYFKYDEKQMRNMILAYMNGVQALYHHQSLGTSIDIAIVRLELMKTQPREMPHYGGERGKLLDSFCDYQRRINPTGDTNPDHWDMALYVSGLDFFAYENGRKSGVTMGLATVGGVCLEKYACVIAELGTTNVFGKPYPSAGFTSVYILAHEIGHNLGMHHDSSGNSCPKEGYVMSPSRGTNGETLWSRCSADVMTKLSWATCLKDTPRTPALDLDHARFLDTPGQQWGAKRQCEILLRDRDAVVSMAGGSKADMCQNLQCRTPHRSGYYYAGPALEGTTCTRGRWCQGGSCVIMQKKIPVKVIKGGWSAWKASTCSSGCITKSKGFQSRRRTCDNPKPQNTEEGCEGSAVDVILCKDDKICQKSKRKTVTAFAGAKCKEFSKLVPELDDKSAGLQAPHEETRPWMACAIFCRRKATGSYYTPRLDLNDLGVDPYFPDGIWCHKDKAGMNFYCVQHHCLPENFRFTKTSIWGTFGEDVPLPGNAPPRPVPLSPHVQNYLSLGPDGRPLLTSLKPEEAGGHTDEDWSDHDYLELPKDEENEIVPLEYDN